MRRGRAEPIRWAIYARKSTDEQLASTEVQVREARAAIEQRGGECDDAHVYIDDARSRAEFKNRPALWRMMADAVAGHFDAVIVRDETRLGGDMHRTGLLMPASGHARPAARARGEREEAAGTPVPGLGGLPAIVEPEARAELVNTLASLVPATVGKAIG